MLWSHQSNQSAQACPPELWARASV